MNNENDILIKIIDFWKKTAEKDRFFPRDAEKQINLKSDEIIAIVGPRRSGKSSLLKLIMQKLPEDTWLYINFEDPFFIEQRKQILF